jgi:hypothetical protein
MGKNHIPAGRTPGDPGPTGKAPYRDHWHVPFYEAFQLELEEYQDILDFKSEYQLSAEPAHKNRHSEDVWRVFKKFCHTRGPEKSRRLPNKILRPVRIDVVIIKKLKDVVITNPLATIFRNHNVVEYKGPSDYVSVADFYKVYAYACLYASFDKVPATDISISFVSHRYPRQLLAHLKTVRNYTVAEKRPGIYHVTGDIFPIQIIDTRKLSNADHLLLRNLGAKLSGSEVLDLYEKLGRRGYGPRLKQYLEVLASINPKTVKEAYSMGKRRTTLEDILIEVGLTAEWEARGEARGKAQGEALGEAQGKASALKKVAKNLLARGLPIEEVAESTELSIEELSAL